MKRKRSNSEVLDKVSSKKAHSSDLVNIPSEESQSSNLPPEIWLEIFEHLDYETLKYTVPLISKYFKGLIEKKSENSHTMIDRILFRDSPVDNNCPIAKQLHPIFSREDFDQSGFSTISSISADGVLPICSFNANFLDALEGLMDDWITHESIRTIWNQNVTSPASQNILLVCWFDIDQRAMYEIDAIRLMSDTKAISVMDVFMAWDLLKRRMLNQEPRAQQRDIYEKSPPIVTRPLGKEELEAELNNWLSIADSSMNTGSNLHTNEMATKRMRQWITDIYMQLETKLYGEEETPSISWSNCKKLLGLD